MKQLHSHSMLDEAQVWLDLDFSVSEPFGPIGPGNDYVATIAMPGEGRRIAKQEAAAPFFGAPFFGGGAWK